MPFVDLTVFIFYFYARFSDRLIMKTKSKDKLPHWITFKFPTSEKQTAPQRNILSQKHFLLLVNLFTPSFTFDLHLNPPIYY